MGKMAPMLPESHRQFDDQQRRHKQQRSQRPSRGNADVPEDKDVAAWTRYLDSQCQQVRSEASHSQATRSERHLSASISHASSRTSTLSSSRSRCRLPPIMTNRMRANEMAAPQCDKVQKEEAGPAEPPIKPSSRANSRSCRSSASGSTRNRSSACGSTRNSTCESAEDDKRVRGHCVEKGGSTRRASRSGSVPRTRLQIDARLCDNGTASKSQGAHRAALPPQSDILQCSTVMPLTAANLSMHNSECRSTHRGQDNEALSRFREAGLVLPPKLQTSAEHLRDERKQNSKQQLHSP